MPKKAGDSLYNWGTKTLLRSFLFWFIAILLLIVGIYLSSSKSSLYKNIGYIVIVLPFIFYGVINKVLLPKYDRIDYGYKGEKEVGKILDSLPDNFKVIHDIFVDKWNIDHLVIGPTGIYTIETKNHRGVITIDGDTLNINGKLFEKNIINQALSEAFYIKEKIEKSLGIKMFIKPVIVFANPKTYVKANEVKGVKILSIRMLKDYLMKNKIVLNLNYIEKIYSIFKN